jgi:hypothetical protein
MCAHSVYSNNSTHLFPPFPLRAQHHRQRNSNGYHSPEACPNVRLRTADKLTVVKMARNSMTLVSVNDGEARTMRLLSGVPFRRLTVTCIRMLVGRWREVTRMGFIRMCCGDRMRVPLHCVCVNKMLKKAFGAKQTRKVRSCEIFCASV